MKPFLAFFAALLVVAAQTHHAAAPGPYRSNADARQDIAAAKVRARAGHKLVMVIFGANWCEDCRVLHQSLESPEVRSYAQSHLEIVSVDIGDDGKKNADVAQDLGVSLAKGLPAAAFLAWDGKPVGQTNSGELEPARNYQPKQILAFLQQIVDHQRITFPNRDHLN